MDKDEIMKVVTDSYMRFEGSVISLKETNEIQQGEGFIQTLVSEDYTILGLNAYFDLVELRRGALVKYGAGNHLNIGVKENLSRAVRHIHSTVGFKTEDGNNFDKELCHVVMRLLMASDCIINDKFKLATAPGNPWGPNMSGYEDWNDTVKLYNNNKLDIPGLSLFPSAMRRILQILGTDMKLLTLYKASKDNDEVLLILDTANKLLTEELYGVVNCDLNRILIMAILALSCYGHYNDDNPVTTQCEQ